MQKMQIDEQELKKKLMPQQYHILREKGTEAPFTSPLLDIKGKGMFTCAVCGNELFSSDAKFDSGTGWPSFDQALPGATEMRDDDSYSTRRTEVVCAKCGSHLGHVFDDGPAYDPSTGSGSKTGKRFCINGACLLHKSDLNA
jgi:peptide-methionine (R)-S-oxide reductase